MAKYRFSIDLGKFFGAKAVTVKGADGVTDVPGIFIPTAINGIQLTTDSRPEDKRNPSGLRCFTNYNFMVPNPRYTQSIKDNIMRRGEQETPYNVPAYTVCFSLKEEIRTRIRQALRSLVVKQQPELAEQEDKRGTELAKAISRLTPFDMGDAYLVEDRTASATPAAGAQGGNFAQTAGTWTPPPATDESGNPLGFEDDGKPLPF